MSKAKIPPELLQKIKDNVNILEVIGEHVVLRKAGSNHVGLCPFHSERTPSFSVNENKQLYHCYGCKKGGDLVSFVREIFGVSFPEAIEELADRARVPLPQGWEGEDSGDPEVQKKRAAARERLQTAWKLNRFAAAFYHQNLVQYPEFDRYFEERGVNADLKRSFYVGAAPAQWDALATHLVAKKAPLPLAVELGLIQPSQKNVARSGPGYFDLFRNRAIFPILDIRGKVVAFGGRAMPGETKGSDTEGPKYLNSRESFIFSKSKVAFGLYQAQKHIREKNEIIIVEGYFDVLALHAAGFQNAVATCGTSLTPDHLSVFRRFADRVTLLFDGDKAGISATGRAMEIGLESGLILYGAVMPAGLDPDEVVLKPDGTARMRAILDAAKPLLDSRIDDAIRYAEQGSEQKTRALKQVAQWLAMYSDPVGREIRAQSFESRMGVSRSLLEQAAGQSGATLGPKQGPQGPRLPGRAPQSGPTAMQGPPARTTSKPLKLSRIEEVLLFALVRKGPAHEIFKRVSENLPAGRTVADLFEHPELNAFCYKFQAVEDPESGVAPDLAGLMTEIQDTKIKALISEALMEEKPRYDDSEIKMAVERGLGRFWARFSQQIKTALRDAEAKKDAGLQANLMKEYLDVQRKLKEFSSFYDEA